jgi:hypothetical protein
MLRRWDNEQRHVSYPQTKIVEPSVMTRVDSHVENEDEDETESIGCCSRREKKNHRWSVAKAREEMSSTFKQKSLTEVPCHELIPMSRTKMTIKRDDTKSIGCCSIRERREDVCCGVGTTNRDICLLPWRDDCWAKCDDASRFSCRERRRRWDGINRLLF